MFNIGGNGWINTAFTAFTLFFLKALFDLIVTYRYKFESKD